MRYPSWLRRLRHSFPGKKRISKGETRHRKTAPLELEWLEDRAAPASLGQHLGAIDGAVTAANATSFSSQIANSNALTNFNLPIIQSSLSDLVSGAISTGFTTAFSDFRQGYSNAQTVAAIEAVDSNLKHVGSTTDAGQLEFQYQTSLAQALAVSAASDLGLGSSYLQNISGAVLSNPKLNLAGTLTILFGSVDTGSGATFFLGGGDIIGGATFKNTSNLGSGTTANLIGSTVTIHITGDVTFNASFAVSVGQAGDQFTGSDLSSLGDQVSTTASGSVTLAAHLNAQLVGVPFVFWDPTITFTMDNSGFTAPTLENGGINIQNARYANKHDLVDAILGVNNSSGLLSSNLFGLSGLKLGKFNLATLVHVAQDFQKLYGAIQDLYGQGFNLDDFTNTADSPSGLDGAATSDANGINDNSPNDTNDSGFDFNSSALASFVAGNTDVTLLTYQKAGDGPSFSNPINIDLFTYSIFGIYFITGSADFNMDLTTHYSIGVGLNGKNGIFFDQANTFFQAQAGASAQFTITGKLFDSDLLITDQGEAGIAGTATMTLKLNDPNNDGKIYLKELGQEGNLSGGLGNLADYLKSAVKFEQQDGGAFVVSYMHKIPAGVIEDAIPPEFRGPVSDFLQSTGLGQFINPGTLFGQVAGGVVQTLGGLFPGGGGGGSSQAADVAAALAPGNEIQILDALANKIQPGIATQRGTDSIPGDVLELFQNRSEFEGIYHHLFGGNNDPANVTQAGYTFMYDLDPSVHVTNYADLNPSNTTTSTSAPQDHINFLLSADKKTLNVTPNIAMYANEGGLNKTITLLDAGGGKVELTRRTVDTSGAIFDDPNQFFTIVPGFQVFISTLGGNNTIFVTPPDKNGNGGLFFNVGVTVGDGNNNITTAGGDDFIIIGSGNNIINTGDGADTVEEFGATSGNNDVTLGEGHDLVDLGNGNNTIAGVQFLNPGGFHAISTFSDYTINVGSGNNMINVGDALNAVVTGGGGNNTMVAGAGTDMLIGSLDKNDMLFAGEGSSTLFGGTGLNAFIAGTGTADMIGGGSNSTNIFYWADGDGNINMDGDGGIGLLIAVGSNSGNNFSLEPASPPHADHAILSRTVPSTSSLDMVRVQIVLASLGSGPNSFTVGDLSGTSVVGVAVAFANHAINVSDHVTLNGRSTADTIGVTLTSPDLFVEVSGLPALFLASGMTLASSDLLSIYGNGGGDIYNVQATGTTTDIVGSGPSTVNVGLAGNSQLILGTLNIENPLSFDTITIDDSADSTAQTATLDTIATVSTDTDPNNTDPYGQVLGLTFANINYEYADTSALHIKGGSGGNTFHIHATGSPTTTIDGGSGNNILTGPDRTNTWNITANNAGNISGVLSSFSRFQNLVGGSGTDSFKLSDNVGVSGTIDGGGGSNTLDYSLYAANHPITVNLQNHSATNINGGNANGFSNIENLVGGAGSDTLVGANLSNTWNITAANAGALNNGFTFSSIENLTGGTGQDLFQFANGGRIGGQIDGGLGINTLAGPNLNQTWNITGNNAGYLSGVVPSFLNIQNLVGGTAQDVFHFADGAGVSGTINGNGGHDFLDYSASKTSVIVNLASGVASHTGGVLNVQNVIGSAVGGDKLTGNALGNILLAHNKGNVLTAGNGSSLLIDGFGKNLLVGGNGGNLLIDGRTTFDSNIAALSALFAEWQSKDSYPLRIAKMRSGAGLAAGNKLIAGTTVFEPQYPHGVGPRLGRGGGNVATTLVGGSGTNWFFCYMPTLVVDLKAGEKVN